MKEEIVRRFYLTVVRICVHCSILVSFGTRYCKSQNGAPGMKYLMFEFPSTGYVWLWRQN